MTTGRPSGDGRRPVPFREYVLKVHQRCNLACDYCYVYTLGDESWRGFPPSMSPEVWRAAGHRIREHALRHALPTARIILHGGEPLLAGPAALVALADDLREVLGDACTPTFVMQTNGVLLDESTLDTLIAAGISIGVSLDGAAEQNDRHRFHRGGRGSADDVARALRLLAEPARRDWFAGILCTVDPTSDPVASYEALLRYRPPALDLLLPHANWNRPPARPFGDWLVAVFDRWYDAAPQETAVHLFVDVIALALGGSSRSEQVGLSPVAVAVIESDGSIEQVDSLKSAYPGATRTGLDVFDNALDEALEHPGVRARQLGIDALCTTCKQCHLHRICGGGHYAHRYRTGSGFDNPSVYCADLMRLIEHVRTRVGADLRRRIERRQHAAPA